jgi:lipid-A-disaccharide synthase
MQHSQAPSAAAPATLKIALVAGERSGDQIGAALLRELKKHYPEAQFVGIGGELMKSEGFDAWWDYEALAVFGLVEVLAHLPGLLRLRRDLRKRLLEEQPDVFIGIDAPDFNLGLERSLRRAGIHTIHYVSPSVWAWRQGRVKKIGASTDLVMCLFPFEPEFYAEHGVAAEYTGHPMADEIPESSDRGQARAELGMDPDQPCVALLPGSRGGEVSRIAPALIEAAILLSASHPGMQYVAPMASPRTRGMFEALLRKRPELSCTITDGNARRAIAAADVVVCASGTAALEAMLVGRPMVVVYRLSRFTYTLARSFGLLKARYFSLPNALAGEPVVPELEQDQVNGVNIAREVEAWLDDSDRMARVLEQFADLHGILKKDAARSAAACVRAELERQR